MIILSDISNIKNNVFRALSYLFAASLTCLTFAGFVAANENSDREFSRKVGKKTHEALQLINNQNYKPATVKLESLLKKSNLSAYERSTISQMNGQAYYELGAAQFAIQAFEDAISAGGLRAAEVNSLRFTIAQIHIAEKEYVRGAEMIEQWEQGGNILKPKYVDLLVTSWMLSENYERALPWAEQWFELSNPKQRKHYDLLSYLYDQLDQTEKQTSLLQEMAEKWPHDRTIQTALDPMSVNSTKVKAGIPSFITSSPKQRGNFKITANDRDAQPIVRIPPIVPPSATVSGYCNVRFNVTIDGTPFDIKSTSCTDYIFELAAIESVQKWKFNPKIRDGRAMERSGVETRVKFFIADLSK